jgi:crotonobetainyl-CoA:carnitine CoA-transferase CaiB-like acyl-CoA transferase
VTEDAIGGGLSGIRVVDFGQYIAGPLAAVMLADQGADVIHVDPPGGPRWKRDSDAFLNRSKRRITLDLHRPDDRSIAHRLVATADVVIENFRTGVMDQFDLGWNALCDEAPRLIYCSLPGFGSDDPRSHLPGWEGVIAAATGNTWTRSGQAPEGWDTSRPTYSSVPVASTFAGFTAAGAIVAALVARHHTGRGQHVEVPLFNAMFDAIAGVGTYLKERGMSPATPMRPRDKSGGGTYQCGDGRYVIFTPTSTRFLRWILDEAGVGTSFAAEGLTEGQRIAADPEVQQRLIERLEELFLTRSAQEWEELGHSASVPLAFIRTPAEWLETPNARDARQVVELNDPEFGPTAMAGLPVHTIGSSARQPRPRHELDADRADILAELDTVSPRAGDATSPSLRRPYENIRVLDLTEILAGPTSGRILADYGAHVVKINSPMGGINDLHYLLNRGKRTILLDVESERGQEVFWRLIENTDVVMQNYPRGTAERYGIGYEHVKARKPDIIYASVNCYGDGSGWDAGRGYETQGEAVSGIMARAGGPNYPPAIIGPYFLCDYGTGAMTSFAVGLAIYHLLVTGEGQQVTSSLAQTGTYLGSSYLLSYDGKVWDDPRGPECLGIGPLQRLYHARDGWFFLGARDDQAVNLRGIEGLGHIDVATADATLEKLLEEAFATQDAASWVTALQGAGLGAHPLVWLKDLMVDDDVVRQQLSVTLDVEGVGEMVMPGIAVKFSDTPTPLPRPVRRPGSDAAEVLSEIGMENQIEELSDAWVLRTQLGAGWP